MRCRLSPSNSIAVRKLVVDAEIPGTEIFVFDAGGNLIHRAVKRFCEELPPALYKIRYQIGDRIVDQVVELPPDEGDYRVKVPELPIVTAVPLTLPASERNWARLASQSRALQLPPGRGGYLSLFVLADPHPDVPPRPGSGLTLHMFSGEMVADFADAETDEDCVGYSLEVNPGNYLLRAIIDSGSPVEQTVVVVEGWHTRIYLRLAYHAQRHRDFRGAQQARDGSEPPGRWEFDLPEMGVILGRGHAQSLLSDTQIRWTAAARQSLAAGRVNAAPDRTMMQALLTGESENPMFGIYAGHLLALQKQPDLKLLREVYERLFELIGEHPDLKALLIPLRDPRAQDLRFAEPPMLRTSWSLVVEASTADHDLRPRGSYSEQISASLWGSGAWLSWRKPPPKTAVINASHDPFQLLVRGAASGKLHRELNSLAASDERQKELSPSERLLCTYLYSIDKQRNFVGELTADADRRIFLGDYYYPLIRRFLRESDLQRQTKESVAHVSRHENVTSFSGLPYSMVLNAASTLAVKLRKPIQLPYPTIHELFKGRSKLMQQLRKSLETSRGGAIVALHGLGGVGKTRAAVEYAWEHQTEYSALLFVIAETPEALRRDLAALTGPLGLPERDTADDDAKLLAALDWLRLNPVWLLIIDGLDTVPALEEATRLIGRMAGGHVLLTTQLRNFPSHINFPSHVVPFELDRLDVEAAAEFLVERTKHRRRQTPDDASKSRELAQELGELALALETAAAFIVEKRVTFSDYLDHWGENRLEVLNWSKPALTQYPRALAVTFQISVNRLSEDARTLLQRLAWFSPEPIPEFVLDVPIPDAEDEDLSNSIDELSNLSLVTRRPENSFFSVHRLLQEASRLSLAGKYRQSLAEAVRWIDAAFTGDPADVDTWSRLDLLWPHASAIAEYAQREQIASATRLTNALAHLLTAKTRYAQREIELGFSPRAWSRPMKRLRLAHTKLEKALEPLNGLTNLEELILTSTYVGNAAPFSRWVNLQGLGLGRTQIISVAPLSELKTLRYLDLRGMKVQNVTQIAELTKLERLLLGHTLVTDISALADLMQLRRLDLSDTQIKDIDKLSGLSNLTRLGLGGTRVHDISALQELTKLRSLDLSDTKVTDLTPLAELRNLEALRLNGAKVREVSVLARLTKLKNLDLSGTLVEEISPLSNLLNLRVLSLGGCTVAAARDLTRLTKLQVLNLGCTRITDVEALRSLVSLRSLDLRGTRVADVRPIGELVTLRSIDLAHTDVTEVAALAPLPCLEILHLEGTRVRDAEVLSSTKKRLKILQEI
jgi:Leucine-rich repeat (LRR) protein